jgi:DNA processing protein
MLETKDKRILYLALTKIPRIGVVRRYELLSKFGSIENVFEQDISKIKEVCNIKSKDFEKLFNKRIIFEKAEKELNEIIKKGYGVVTLEDETYPANLKNISDPPILMYYKGNITTEDINSVGIVGTRTPSKHGMEIAYKIAYDLSKASITIVSGLAKGIDSSGHRGCVDANGRTIAVLGSGIDIIYPYENRKLAEKIIANGGLILSEFPIGTKPERYNFPQRNRIIAGITLGIIVIQSPEDSGSLITAKLANDYGRSIFAVPGSPNSRLYKGSNQLIKDGAILVENANDILEQIKYELSPIRKDINNIIENKREKVKINKNYELIKKEKDNIEDKPDNLNINEKFPNIDYDILSDEEKKILPYITVNTKKHIDQLCIESGLNINVTNKILTSLLLKDIVEEHNGKYFTLKVDL